MTDPIDNGPNASCLNCPSLLPADNSSFFNKSIGAPVCARFGKPIGRMNSKRSETEAIAKHFAKSCTEFGQPAPAVPNWSKASFTVMLPDPQLIGAPQESPDLVSSCAGCARFVREDVVAVELGWSTGLCSAKGKLLLGSRYTLEARNCDVRSFGQVRQETTGLMYLPEYDDNFIGSADPIRHHQKEMQNWVDPTLYPTDKPVDPADQARGIRAWRKVTDPATGNSVFLPIYNIEHFSPEEQALIPRTGDDEHPEDYVDHNFYTYKVTVLWTELDETPAMWGQAGVGKTEFFRYMAWLMCLPFYRFSITASTELDDLAGTTQYTEGIGTHFEKGRLVRAWEKPCVMVVDEPNTGQNDVWQFLRPMTDNSKQLVLDSAPGAPKFDRDLDCYLGMAMNPAWDPINVGTQPISDADTNRLMHFYVELPPEPLEREIILKRVAHDDWELPADYLDMVMGIAADVRELAKNGTLPVTWAIRPQLKVARALRWFDFFTAYRMAAVDFLEPEQQEILLGVVRAHVES